MTERLRDTASRRHGHLLLLSGEAGAGKKTLLEAFRNEHLGTETFWGTCDGLVPPRPFAPISDVAASVGDPLRTALETVGIDTRPTFAPGLGANAVVTCSAVGSLFGHQLTVSGFFA